MASSNSSLSRVVLPALVLASSVAFTPAGSAEPALGQDFNLNNILDTGPTFINLLDDFRPGLAASAFVSSPTVLDDRTSFAIQFVVGAHGAADGYTVAFVNGSSGSDYLGLPHGNLGFFSPADATGHPRPIGPAYAIAFDFYQNTDYQELPGLHLAALDLSQYSPRVQVPAPLPINNGKYSVWIDYSAAAEQVAVYLSDEASKPASPVMIDHINLALYLGGLMYPGFTGGNGPTLTSSVQLTEFNFSTSTAVPLPAAWIFSLSALSVFGSRRKRAGLKAECR